MEFSNKRNSFYEEREKYVMDFLHNKGRLTVTELCSNLNISASTARILLQKMHDKGLLVRTHGGAIKSDYPSAINTTDFYSSDFFSNTLNLEKKKQIAAAAAATVNDGDSIAISSGSTALFFALLLKDRKELSVITNSIPVANILMFQPNIHLSVCGGQIRPRNGACFGPTAENFLTALKVDKSYCGCDSVNLDYGISDFDIDPRSEKYLCHCGRIRYILADSTKFKVKPFIEKIIDIKDVDYIVSDSSLDETSILGLKDAGTEVIIG